MLIGTKIKRREEADGHSIKIVNFIIHKIRLENIIESQSSSSISLIQFDVKARKNVKIYFGTDIFRVHYC